MATLTIEHLQVTDLPSEWAQRLHARPGQTVTVRIDTDEECEPTQPTSSFTTDDPAFGIWRDYEETADVSTFVRHLRSSRYHNDASRHSG